MERYCGYLQAGLRSRTHPWANLNNKLLHKAYLEQIDIYYDLQDDLTITSSAELKRGEKTIRGCRFHDYYFFHDYDMPECQILTQFYAHLIEPLSNQTNLYDPRLPDTSPL